MSCQEITVTPSEEGTAKVTVTPTDEDGNVLSFSDLTDPEWQLMRLNDSGVNVVVNERTFTLSDLDSLIWALSGDDLAIFGDNDSGWRTLAFQASYDSDLGVGLPLKGEAQFEICKLTNIEDQSDS